MQFKRAGDAKLFDSNRIITGGKHFIHIEIDILTLRRCLLPKEIYQSAFDQDMLLLSVLLKNIAKTCDDPSFIRNTFHHLKMKYEEYKCFTRVLKIHCTFVDWSLLYDTNLQDIDKFSTQIE